MQTVLPAKVFSRGGILIIFTVLSPIGLTTPYTGSADPPRTAPDVCAAAETLKTTSANEITSVKRTFRTDCLADVSGIRKFFIFADVRFVKATMSVSTRPPGLMKKCYSSVSIR
jgi:hypothetical protein